MNKVQFDKTAMEQNTSTELHTSHNILLMPIRFSSIIQQMQMSLEIWGCVFSWLELSEAKMLIKP